MSDDDDTVIIREADDDVTTRKEQAAEKRREDAFNAGYNWKGVEFEGISSSRKDLWTSLCHKAGFPNLDSCFDDLTLFIPRAKALVWVCSTPAKTLRSLRSQGMDACLEAFENWCDSSVAVRDEKEILRLGLRIFNDSSENAAEAAQSALETPGKR
jgi:hypothetical protein